MNNAIYLVGGAAGGMVLAYLFMNGGGDGGSMMAGPAHPQQRNIIMTATAAPTRPAPHSEEEEEMPPAAPKKEAQSQDDQATTQPNDDAEKKPIAATAEPVEKEEEHAPPRLVAFDRYHGWSSYGPKTEPYNVAAASTVESCEQICQSDDRCDATTFVGGRCGLFELEKSPKEHGLSGEANLEAITSVKVDAVTPSDDDGAVAAQEQQKKGGKTCFGPVITAEGQPNVRPASAPCFASEQEALTTQLKNAEALSVFAPMFNPAAINRF